MEASKEIFSPLYLNTNLANSLSISSDLHLAQHNDVRMERNFLFPYTIINIS